MDPSSILPGTRLGPYAVEGRLGEGGMGVVFRVRHVERGTVHALKLLTVPSPAARDRFRREAELQAGLSHPNVVRASEVLDCGDQLAIVLEYVEGRSLEALLAERRPSRAEIDRIARDVLAGVAAAHRAGVVHRDLKPANLLVDEAAGAKVADFGLAKALDGGGSCTRTGVLLGTPGYLSPEQLHDAKHVGAASDVFALGAVLYELCTGRRAFARPTPFETCQAIAAGRYVPPRALVPDLPRRMERAITAALQVDPARRPRSVEALAALWDDASTPEPALVLLAGLAGPAVTAQLGLLGLFLAVALSLASPGPPAHPLGLERLRAASLPPGRTVLLEQDRTIEAVRERFQPVRSQLR